MLPNKRQLFFANYIAYIVVGFVIFIISIYYFASDFSSASKIDWWLWIIIGLVIGLIFIVFLNYRKENSKTRKFLTLTKPTTTASQSGPSIGTVIGFGIALIVIWFLIGYAKGCGQSLATKKVESNIITTPVSYTVERKQLIIGTNHLIKGEKYWYYRDEATSLQFGRFDKNNVILTIEMYGSEEINHREIMVDSTGNVTPLVMKDNHDPGHYYVVSACDVVAEVKGVLNAIK